MITGTIKSQVDQIWNAFWSGGISNPMEVIEQMTYLLFIKRLDEMQTVKEKKANRTRQPVENPIFNSRQQKLRWSHFKDLGDPGLLYHIVSEEVFPFIKKLGGHGIRANENHIAIAKLKHNKPLTPTDLSELERFVYESEPVESRDRFEQCFGHDKPLTVFIRSLVGLDRNAAKEAFGQFLDENRYSSQQICFVEMLIDRLTRSGVMDPGQLYDPPFTSLHHEGLDGTFGDSDANAIVDVLAEINRRAAA